jgi:serine/threonine protein kinase/predicted Zn-dependent protease
MIKAGSHIGPFLIEDQLGRGGMGAVYQALDTRADRRVALKVLLRSEGSGGDRFLREAQVAAGLDHAGIVRVHDAGVFEGATCIVYELVEGGAPLHRVLTTLPLTERLDVVLQVADALTHVHERGLVHRDVKPANVILDAKGRARLTDFGLVSGKDLDRLTHTGAVLGTPGYMAPEQIGAERAAIGPATDVWALGVLLYEALCQQLPFPGDSAAEFMFGARKLAPPSPASISSEPLPPGAAEVCLRALAKAPSERHAHAGEFHAALSAVLTAPASPSRGPRPLVRGSLALAALSGALALTLLATGSERSGSDASSPTPSAAPTEGPGEEWLRTGGAHYDEQRWSEAVAAYSRALDLDPQDPRALLGRAAATQAGGDSPGALPDLDALLLLQPKHGEAYYRRATAEWDVQGRWQEPPDLHRDVQSADGFFFRAMTRQRAHDLPNAIADLAQVIMRYPTAYSPYRLRAQLRTRLGDLNGALRDLGEVLRAKSLPPGLVVPVRLERAQLLLRLDRLKEALADTQVALDREPQSILALLASATARRRLEDFDGSEADVAAAQKVKPIPTNCLAPLARLCESQGDFDTASLHWARLVDREPKNTEALWDYAELAADMEQWKLATTLLRRLLVLRPKAASIQADLARALHKQGELKEGERFARSALSMRSRDPKLRLTLALLLRDQERGDEALAEVQHVLKAAPEFADAHFQHAQLRIQRKELDEALRSMNRALSINKRSRVYLEARSSLLSDMGKHALALDDLNLLIARLPSAKYFTWRGNAYRDAGYSAKALLDYGRALKRQPKRQTARVNRALLLGLVGRKREALADFNRLVQLDPANPQYWRLCARARIGTGDFRGGLQAATTFRDKAPQDPDGPILEADAWLGLGDPRKAKAALEDLLAREPKNAPALDRLARALRALEAWPELVAVLERLLPLLDPKSAVTKETRGALKEAKARLR